MTGLSLRHKLTGLVAGLVVAIALGIGLYLPHRMASHGERELERRALAVLAVIAADQAAALAADDPAGATGDLARLDGAADAVWAAVVRTDGTRFAAWRPDALHDLDRGAAPGVTFLAGRAVAAADLGAPGPAGQRIGRLVVGFSLDALTADAREDRIVALMVSCLALAAGVIGAYAIAGALTRPIDRLILATRRLADGDLDVSGFGALTGLPSAPSGGASRDEVDQLTLAVRAMAMRLAGYVQGIERARLDAEAAEKRAIAASYEKSMFLANMSHELRTPLNAIIGYSEILTEENEDPALHADLARIHAAATHLFDIISGILDISKIESGRMELLLESWSLSELVHGVVETSRGLIEKQGSKLIVDVRPDVRDITSDLVKVRQILLNLLSNAAKFTADGEVRLTVERRQELRGSGWFVVTVSDTGIGMSPDQLERVFLPFTQADPSTTRRFGGTGLGLAITHRYCDMLGGRITVESAVGNGTTFTVWLPERFEGPTPR